MDRYLVKTDSGLVRVARVAQEVVMTARGYAQPASVSIGGKRVKGYVFTALAYRDSDGCHPFFVKE